MKLIPIHDDTAPITCTIDSDEIPAHIEVIERLHTNLDHIDRTDHGLLLHFPLRPDIEADVRRFAIEEKRCCQFWGFAINATDDSLTLRWDGPSAVEDFMDRLKACFEGDEPITATSGLL